MKKVIYCVVILAFSACNNSNNDKTSEVAADTTETAVYMENICLLHTDGLQQQDTTLVKLEIHEGVVTGSLNYTPFEKDGARGSVTGSKDGDIITGTWHYMIEGSEDSTLVAFKLTKEGALQKKAAYDEKTGKMYLPDTAQYTVEYKRIDCDK